MDNDANHDHGQIVDHGIGGVYSVATTPAPRLYFPPSPISISQVALNPGGPSAALHPIKSEAGMVGDLRIDAISKHLV